ncbi:SDR family NAD(P)-dependent oxidoreductase, partial [Bordetella hinzii]|nr:SDR family NAD(P)-dependent oxidoreductase [Bordetella hinzii]
MAGATARRFAAEGAAVVLVDLRAQAAGMLAQEIRLAGGRAQALAADITDEAAVKQAVAAALAEFGKIDILFNCAGG